MPKDKIKEMSVAEFRRLGLLQEINRQFLHPRGLALEVLIDEVTRVETFGSVWDYRDDPEGMIYADGVIDLSKATSSQKLLEDKEQCRLETFGWVIQPLVDVGSK
jgi:hypothetical protein